MKHAGGRPLEPRREKYRTWLPLLTVRQASRTLTMKLLDQLDACQSDEARRLILGVSEKETA